MDNKSTSFTSDEILKFHDIMNISETELQQNPYGFNMNDGAVKDFKQIHKLLIKSSSQVTKHNDVNCIIYTKSRKTRGASFIAHIRNAYAHSNISIEGEYFVIRDYKYLYKNKKKVDKKMTAYGKIHRELLFPFIDCMLEDRNKNKLN